MKKIPTLFERTFENHNIVSISPIVYPGMEWVLNGEGIATIKHDGSCCAIIKGKLYKRYDAKKGKTPPNGAIPCQPEPDPITGHWPHWLKCEKDNREDKWFFKALSNTINNFPESIWLTDRTYEAVGLHFNGNPYGYDSDVLIPHGTEWVTGLERSFEGIREYLRTHPIEGIVFWKDGRPQCKIKRTDFGFEWPIRIEDESGE